VEKETVTKIKKILDLRLEKYLLEMKEGHDDSVTGFNEACDVMQSTFDEIIELTDLWADDDARAG
jgi:hypothetical protein